MRFKNGAADIPSVRLDQGRLATAEPAAEQSARGRAHAFVDEALKSPPVEILADVDVSFAVSRQRVRHVE